MWPTTRRLLPEILDAYRENNRAGATSPAPHGVCPDRVVGRSSRPTPGRAVLVSHPAVIRHPDPVTDDLNVLDGPLEECGTEPVTGFYRDGHCHCGPEDRGSHSICAVMTTEFLRHQQSVGNDLITPRPEYGFPGLRPGDRWCVVAVRWLQAYRDGVAAPVVLASTSRRALEIVPLEYLREHAVDVPADPSSLS
jgi:uncharacterized protein (DUF2237 family)